MVVYCLPSCMKKGKKKVGIVTASKYIMKKVIYKDKPIVKNIIL